MEWTKEKPKSECVFVSRAAIGNHWEYRLYDSRWEQEDGMDYLVVNNENGDYCGTINELHADEYLIINKWNHTLKENK